MTSDAKTTNSRHSANWQFLLPALSLCLLHQVPVGAASPVLVRIVNGVADLPTIDGKIKFHNVGFTDGEKTFSSTLNPIITGHNVYATDTLRVDIDGNPAWRVYRGAWQVPGQVNDRIYRQTSDGIDPGGTWTAPQVAIDHGQYIHVNDPSVVFDQGVYTMFYTTLKDVSGGPDPNGVKDWVNYSTSTDGINWTPSAGSTSTEISLSDPNGKALGTVGEIARPSLVKTDTGWRMWFDALTNEGLPTERRDSYLAEATNLAPTNFRIIHRYPTVNGGFPGFFEPDVEIRPDGTYLAVVQRNFNKLWQATSADGINFTFSDQPILDVAEPAFTTDFVSNPGLLYDQIDDLNYGVSFGMASAGLTDHDIGFAYSQYIINVRSPGDIWHSFAASELMVDQFLSVFQFDEFDLVRITDPVTGDVVLERDFSGAHPGDSWELRQQIELSADFDNDGDVDGGDFIIWQQNAGLTSVATINEGDANGDGDVDGDDLSLWEAHYGFSTLASANSLNSSVTGTVVPEPTSALLMLTAFIFLGRDNKHGRLPIL